MSTCTNSDATGSRRCWSTALVAGVLAGAYVAVAGLLAVVVSAGLDPRIWGSVHALVRDTVFTMALVLLLVAAPPWARRFPAAGREPLSPPAGRTGVPEAARSR